MAHLIASNEFIAKRQSRHQATLLEPIDCTERAREENALDGGERDKTLSKRARVADPAQRPLRLLLHTRHSVDRVEQTRLLGRTLDQRVNQQRVRFGVHVLNRNLKAIKATLTRQEKTKQKNKASTRPINHARARTHRASGNCTSFMKRVARFSFTMPSEAAKKASTWLMK